MRFNLSIAGLIICVLGLADENRLAAQANSAQLRSPRIPLVAPDQVGLSAAQLQKIHPLVEEGIRQGKMPGCVVCVGRHGKIAYLEAFGNRLVGADPEPMTIDTVFDMASITKPVATASSIMKLVEAGKLRLEDKVVAFLPEFAPHGKDQITIRNLLTHQSGLIPDNALKDYQDGPELAWQRICELELIGPVGTKFKYSDVNFIVLGQLVRQVSGQSLDEFARDQIFSPLGMAETGFRPDDHLKERSAPTEKRDGQWIRGEVHDPRAFLLDQVAGHAGLFSTAQDMAIYAQMMLDEGTCHARQNAPVRIFSPSIVQTMTRAWPVSSGIRGLGWDKQTGYSSNKGDLLTAAAFGHGGFTGTVLWIDPELDLFFIFLSNRVHPNGKGSVNHLAGRVLNVIAAGITDPNPVPVAGVLTGVDVIERDQFSQLAGQRIGLISNHTGRNVAGKLTAQLFHDSPRVDLTTLFSPEHGFEGTLDTARIDDRQDPNTGLKIYSLYGATRRPTKPMLDHVDTLVFDIQDIGTRFYTYISTLGESMRAADQFGKRIVVLDRPNPINGLDVTGPLLDAGKESFVAFHRLPVRHGMTSGEIAKLLRSELQLNNLDLVVVPCEGWNRQDYWDRTGLTWVNPSPNMRSLTQAILYPGIGLLEMTNVSVGRGTDRPFEVMGAPWIQGPALARRLNNLQLPGIAFVPIEFTPDASKFQGDFCQGIEIMIIDRKQVEPIRIGLSIAAELHRQYPDDWDTTHFDRLLGNDAVRVAVLNGEPIDQIMQAASLGQKEFLELRKRFLIYK